MAYAKKTENVNTNNSSYNDEGYPFDEPEQGNVPPAPPEEYEAPPIPTEPPAQWGRSTPQPPTQQRYNNAPAPTTPMNEQPAYNGNAERTVATKKEIPKVNAEYNKLKTYEKLARISATLNAPKNLYCDYGDYWYRNAESILEAVKPLCIEYNCLLYMEDTIEAIGEITEQSNNGIVTRPNTYVKAIAHFINCENGEEIKTSAFAKEAQHKQMSSDQCTGTASSYARKYCLNALFSIDDVKDSDTDELKRQTNNRQNNGGYKNNNSYNNNADFYNSQPPQNNGGWGTNNNSGWGNNRT